MMRVRLIPVISFNKNLNAHMQLSLSAPLRFLSSFRSFSLHPALHRRGGLRIFRECRWYEIIDLVVVHNYIDERHLQLCSTYCSLMLMCCSG